MADIVSPEKRSNMMSGIKCKDTKPEMTVRKLLHAAGYRFRLHKRDLPGRPDIVLPRHRAVVFVNGCYWHGHEECRLFCPPKSQTDFWVEKIAANRARDKRNHDLLTQLGWTVIVVWECAVKGSGRLQQTNLVERLSKSISLHNRNDIRGIQSRDRRTNSN